MLARIVLFAALLLVVIEPASAYKPESGHQWLTQLAGQHYRHCVQDSALIQVSGWQDRLVEGNRVMDEGLGFDLLDWWRLDDNGVFSLWRRSVNWHFYHPDRTDYSRAMLVEQSLERLWRDLKQGVNQHDTPYHQLMFVGGLLHFVEDMTVPAHVVPVYHGPTLIELVGPFQLKPLVQYMQDFRPEFKTMIVDAIDDVPVQMRELASQLSADGDFCQAIEQDTPNIDAVLEQTARQTLYALKQAIPGCPEHRWQDFWQPPVDPVYFGRYALYHQDGSTANPLFGEAGELENRQGQVCRFEVNDPRYRDFVRARHLDAIRADLRVLNWAERQLAE